MPLSFIICHDVDFATMPRNLFAGWEPLNFALIDFKGSINAPLQSTSCSRFSQASMLDFRGSAECPAFVARCQVHLVRDLCISFIIANLSDAVRPR